MYAVAAFGPQIMHYRGDLTRDGYIPFKLFWLWYEAIPRKWALDTLQLARGVGLAVGVAFGSKQAERGLRELTKEATGGR